MNNEIQKSWARRHPVLAGIGIFFLIGLVGSLFSDTPTPTASVKTEERVTVITTDQKLQGFPSGTGMKFSNREQDEDLMLVTYDVTNLRKESLFIANTGDVSSNTFQEIFTSFPEVKNVSVDYRATTTDAYGNQKFRAIYTYVMKRDTFQKINWANFNKFNLCTFARAESRNTTGETDCIAKISF